MARVKMKVKNKTNKTNKNLNEYIQLYSFEYNESCVLWVCAHCMFINFFNILSPLKEQRSLHN